MHKEIEEARAWSNARPSEFAVDDFKRWCLKGTIHARRLLFLFDRMQQEPVVEIEHNRCPILGHINGVRTKPSVVDEGTYRRELEDK